MVGKPRPHPGFLDTCEKYKVVNGRQLWVDGKRERYFSWDSLHGEIEAFDKAGRHIGAFDAVTGVKIKDAVRGRRVDV